jgi:hypothetical protein
MINWLSLQEGHAAHTGGGADAMIQVGQVPPGDQPPVPIPVVARSRLTWVGELDTFDNTGAG